MPVHPLVKSLLAYNKEDIPLKGEVEGEIGTMTNCSLDSSLENRVGAAHLGLVDARKVGLDQACQLVLHPVKITA